jgi:hypothetical protein
LARQEDVDWEPDWTRYRFVALLRCDNGRCAEPAVAHGEGRVELDPEEGSEDAFYPRFIYPSPDLFTIAKGCPPALAVQIRRAFVLSWGDYDACANQTRIALERLLTEQRVPAYSIKNGHRRFLSLHSRIERFADSTSTKTKHLSDLMKAVKWLGNVGSHGLPDNAKRLNRSDIFDAFDLLQYVLDELYTKKSSNLSKLAREINRRKGPARRR